MASKTSCTIEVSFRGKTYEVDEVEALDYSSDILAVGDEFHLTVVNEKKKYSDKLLIGSQVKIYLQNPEVLAGARTLKFLGRITNREANYSPQTGSVVKLTCADLGWHLLNCCAPLFYNLRKGSLDQLLDQHAQKALIDRSWGIQGVRYDNKTNRKLKQGAQAAEALRKQKLGSVYVVQIEAGDVPFDKIVTYAKRNNRLINVSVDGYIQVFSPDYATAPHYSIRCTDTDGNNNVIKSRMVEDLRNIYTEVECVGQQVGWQPQDPNDPNAGKRRGAWSNSNLLPFVHRLTFADAEVYNRELSAKNALWRAQKALYESWFVEYKVYEHHSSGHWWEADTQVDVQDDELGISGALYISQVRCESSPLTGDTTTLVCRKPGLLSASFGEIPSPGYAKSSPPPSKGSTK